MEILTKIVKSGDAMININMLTPILATLPQALLIVNSQGDILYANKQYQQIVGVQTIELIEQNIFNIAPHCPLVQTLSTSQQVAELYAYPLGSGGELFCTTYPLLDQGELFGAMEVVEPLDEYIMSLGKMEKQMIIKGLNLYGSSMKGKIKTAQLLNISLATLYNKIKKYKI